MFLILKKVINEQAQCGCLRVRGELLC